MSDSDSIFLLEVIVEELTSFTKVKSFRIKAKFGDVFSIKLRDPNELIAEAMGSRKGKRGNRKFRIRKGKLVPPSAPVPQTQTVMIASDIESLVTNMLTFPLELSMFSKEDPFIFGLVEIPWNPQYITYLRNLTPEDDRVVLVREIHRVFDYRTSKCIAVLKMKVKMNQVRKDPIVKPEPPLADLVLETGTIKTIYSGGNTYPRKHRSHRKKEPESEEKVEPNEPKEIVNTNENENNLSVIMEGSHINSMKSSLQFENNLQLDTLYAKKCISSGISLIRSQTDLDNNNSKYHSPKRHWSSTSLEIKQHLDTLSYIFGNYEGPFGNKVYCVNYFTVENEWAASKDSSPKSKSPESNTPVPKTPESKSPEVKSPTPKSTDAKSTTSKSPPSKSSAASATASKVGSAVADIVSKLVGDKPPSPFSFNVCSSKCQMADSKNNVVQLDFTSEAADITDVTACTRIVNCDFRKQREPTGPREPATLLDLSNYHGKVCCEELFGGVKTLLGVKVDKDPCLCTCECTFGFVKKTTYCDICGGYEKVGDEVKATRGGDPFPCPIYHKLAEVGSKKKTGGPAAGGGSLPAVGGGTGGASGVDKKSERSESEKDGKKGKKKKKKDDRFKFNYGYKAPQIGHSRCALPCSGNMNPVPKHMGWLWTADNIPGLKVRPNWKPGAANKHVVRMLRIARFPEQIKARKKKDTGKKKRPLKRPLLIVQKTDGEYTVTMETMRQFNRPRAPNQYPYEDKPLVTYKVGRTEEENKERQKRKERAQRRLEREKRAFIQSTFTDMCKEICQKTYEQALGLLPFAEDPLCPCYPIEPDATRIDLSHSCSCTESTRSSESATDDDEWIVEFTPPNAYFNPAYKGKKVVKVDRDCQYSYLDYRVKLLDRLGNPVPRFFTGPTGNQECSDLGGFWGPNKKWLEINVDGYVGPDNRWAPNFFLGPDGDHVDAETGKFQLADGSWLVVGVDGYVDNGQWRFYSKPKIPTKNAPRTRQKGEKKKPKDNAHGPSDQAFSCFGETSPRTLSQMGILGHGHDRRLLLSTLEKLMKAGEDITIPHTPKIPTVPRKKGKKPRRGDSSYESHHMWHTRGDRHKCKHVKPSDKGVMTVDNHGRKTYFKANYYKNPRPKQRLNALGEKGISVSSFHIPCFDSFIDSEEARRQQYAHIINHNARVMAGMTQDYAVQT